MESEQGMAGVQEHCEPAPSSGPGSAPPDRPVKAGSAARLSSGGNAPPGATAITILGFCFALALIGRGAFESFTVFLLPISQTFHWDRAAVVSIYALSAFCSGLASPLVGRLFDRSGPLAVYALGLFLIGFGFSVSAFASELWQFQLCIGIAAGFGFASLGTVGHSLLLGRWFGRRLPTAMAVVYSATGAGVLTMLPLTQLLIDNFGWRGTYHILGAASLILIAPLMLLPWRRWTVGTAHATIAPATHAGDHWSLGRAIRHHAFWALFSTFFFTAVGVYAISVQVVAYLVESGFPPLQAASAWGFSGVALVIGMLTISWLDSIIGRRRAILLSYTMTTLGLVMLWLLQYYPSLWLLVGFLVFFGSTIGSRGPLITAAAMTIYRGKRVGTIFGSISIGSGLGAAIGSWSGGLIHDITQSYDWLIAFALISVWLGMIPFLTVRALRD